MRKMSIWHKSIFIIFFLLLLTACTNLESTNERWYLVERVIDGDTIQLASGEKVRLIGVDTPETVKPNTPVEPFGKEASDFTKKMLTNTKVRLEFDVQERDKYGRLLAYLYLPDGTFYNELLLKEGYAQVLTIPPNVKYAELFLLAERMAREEKKGLWQDNLQMSNRSQENGKLNENKLNSDSVNNRISEQGLIKGNINSRGEKIYHLPGSRYYDITKAEEWFRTEEEAQSKGYRKAK